MGGEISFEKIVQNIDMRDVLSALNSEYAIQSTHSSWHPSEIAEQFEDAYDIVAYVTFGENLQQQYHIIFNSSQKDPYLYRGMEYIKVCGAFSEGSTGARKWLNNVLEIYVEKLIGDGIGRICPVFELFHGSCCFKKDLLQIRYVQ